MKWTELVADKCQAALNGKEAVINLAGMPENAASRIRTLVSLFGNEYRVKMSVNFDRENNALKISKAGQRKEKTAPVTAKIPDCLFRFMNGRDVSNAEGLELVQFYQTLGLMLKGDGTDEIIIPEDDGNLI